MKKVLIILVIIFILVLIYNPVKDVLVKESEEIEFVEVNVVGYVAKPGTYEDILVGTSRKEVVEMAGLYVDSVYLYPDEKIEESVIIEVKQRVANPFNINYATYEELTSITGIGEAKANIILSRIANNNFFTSFEELKETCSLSDKSLLDAMVKAIIQ